MNPALVERVRNRLVLGGAEPTVEAVADALRAEHQVAGSDTLLALVDVLRSDLIGAGPLDHLLGRPGVTDVLVNGHDQVFIDRGDGLEPVDLDLGDEAAVRRLAQRLAVSADRRLDESKPLI